MHEFTIAQSIWAIAENAVPKNSNAVVANVSLQIGELSGIEIESLEFAFSVIKTGTLLFKADLDIQIIKGEAECSDCKTIFPLSFYGNCCPTCNSYAMKILSGQEMKVVNITIEEGDN